METEVQKPEKWYGKLGWFVLTFFGTNFLCAIPARLISRAIDQQDSLDGTGPLWFLMLASVIGVMVYLYRRAKRSVEAGERYATTCRAGVVTSICYQVGLGVIMAVAIL